MSFAFFLLAASVTEQTEQLSLVSPTLTAFLYSGHLRLWMRIYSTGDNRFDLWLLIYGFW
jgi:hypothetical protein